MMDCAVIGLGAAGSAAVSALAQAHVSVIGLDCFAPPHSSGSSHGETRLLRAAYAEGALYVPMARRAIALWRALEERRQVELFRQSGVVYAGPDTSPFLSASLEAARHHGVSVDIFSPAARTRMRDTLNIPDAWICCAEREGGYLFAERAISALGDDARAHDAELCTNEACVSLTPRRDGVVIATERREVEAKTCIVAAGAWTPMLLPALAPYLRVERKTLYWFADPTGAYAPDAFQPFLIDNEFGRQAYGFPDCGTGVKIAEHTEASAEFANPDEVTREVAANDVVAIEDLARPLCRKLGAHLRSLVCLYPMSRDGHFIIDAMPGMKNVFVAAGLSGHGFKFAPVIGEAVANLALGRPQAVDIAPFAVSRFGSV